MLWVPVPEYIAAGVAPWATSQGLLLPAMLLMLIKSCLAVDRSQLRCKPQVHGATCEAKAATRQTIECIVVALGAPQARQALSGALSVRNPVPLLSAVPKVFVLQC